MSTATTECRQVAHESTRGRSLCRARWPRGCPGAAESQGRHAASASSSTKQGPPCTPPHSTVLAAGAAEEPLGTKLLFKVYSFQTHNFFVNLFSPKVNDLCEERAGGFAQKTCGWRPRLPATQAAGRPEPVWVLGPPPPPARPPAAARPRQVVARGAVSTQTGAPRAARGNSLLEPLSRFRPLVSLNQEPRDSAA